MNNDNLSFLGEEEESKPNELKTIEKYNLVGAINEIYDKLDQYKMDLLNLYIMYRNLNQQNEEGSGDIPTPPLPPPPVPPITPPQSDPSPNPETDPTPSPSLEDTSIVASYLINRTAFFNKTLSILGNYSPIEKFKVSIEGIESEPTTTIKLDKFDVEEGKNLKILFLPGERFNKIYDNMFRYMDQLYEISIPEGFTELENNCFGYTSNLSKIKLPNSLVKIGSFSFNGSGITNITIPPNVSSLGESCFRSCGRLTEINFSGNSITTIKKNAFNNCKGLENLVLPNSVTSIGEGAFDKCTKLTSLVISENIQELGRSGQYSYTFGNCIKLENLTFPNLKFSISLEDNKLISSDSIQSIVDSIQAGGQIKLSSEKAEELKGKIDLKGKAKWEGNKLIGI